MYERLFICNEKEEETTFLIQILKDVSYISFIH